MQYPGRRGKPPQAQHTETEAGEPEDPVLLAGPEHHMETTMTHCTQYSLKPVLVAVALSLAAAYVPLAAHAAGATDTEATGIARSRTGDDPAMAQIAVNSGRALINHLQSARALLDEGRVAQARSALIAGREFADAIERTMPYLLVVEEMRDAGDHVVQENVAAIAADFLPIYADLDELQVYAPAAADKARDMVRKAEKRAAAGDGEDAAAVLKEAAAAVAEHTVYLPVEYVDQQVHAALYAIDRPKPDLPAAGAAVDRALNSLTVVVDSVVATPAG
jgi:hypothetical protein